MIDNKDIIEISDKQNRGENLSSLCKKYGISRQTFYTQKEELIKNGKLKNTPIKLSKNLTIDNMHILSNILDTDFDTLHKYVDVKKSEKANKKRILYLKNNNKEQLKKELLLTVLNFYDIDINKLIELINGEKDIS